MHLGQLRKQFSNEAICRQFFEHIIWSQGRECPHCGCKKSYSISGRTSRAGLYECAHCKRQFTVTVNTPFHGTKLPLWIWIKAIYLIVTSSKGISSVVLGRMIGVSQKTAWKMGHSIRKMMDTDVFDFTRLKGTVELDEMFVGGKPRYNDGIKHKRGKGTSKSQVLIATERSGPAHCHVIDSDKISEIQPLVELLVDQDSHLMTDKSLNHMSIGQQFKTHSAVNHSAKEYAKGDIHSNTAESFASQIERARIGVFHYMSKKHLQRYLTEVSFRWRHRVEKPQRRRGKKKKKTWQPLPFLPVCVILLSNSLGYRVKSTSNGSIREFVRPYLTPPLDGMS